MNVQLRVPLFSKRHLWVETTGDAALLVLIEGHLSCGCHQVARRCSGHIETELTTTLCVASYTSHWVFVYDNNNTLKNLELFLEDESKRKEKPAGFHVQCTLFPLPPPIPS